MSFFKRLFGGSAGTITAAGCTSPDTNTKPDADADFWRGLKKSHSDLDGCIADYTRAIELTPDLPLAFYNRGEAKHSKRDFEGAIADHTKDVAELLLAHGTDVNGKNLRNGKTPLHEAASKSPMVPVETRNRNNGAWKLKDDEKHLNNAEGS